MKSLHTAVPPAFGLACIALAGCQDRASAPDPRRFATPLDHLGSETVPLRSVPLSCGTNPLVVGRSWTVDDTSVATATGSGGYVRRVWDGEEKEEHHLEKKILAMEGDAVTSEEVTSDGSTYTVSPDDVLTETGESAGNAFDPNDSEVRLRWPNIDDPNAFRVVFIKFMHWDDPEEVISAHARVSKTKVPAGHPGAWAAHIEGDAMSEFAGLGHGGLTASRMSGTMIFSSDGVLLDAQLTTVASTIERLNAACNGRPCPYSDEALTRTKRTIHVACAE